MDIDLLRQAMTVISFLVFLGIVAFAAHPRNKRRFEEAARLPLDEETLSPTLSQGRGGKRSQSRREPGAAFDE